MNRNSIFLLTLPALMSACAPTKEAVPTPSAPRAAAASKEAEKGELLASVRISKTIQKACGLSDDDAHFAYDSSALRSSDSGLLNDLARCFVIGPLSGQNLSLIGHADPRGDAEYNMLLGGRRSDTVKDYLVSQGMLGSHIQTTSRGEIDATGNGEEGWREDRRVDAKLTSER